MAARDSCSPPPFEFVSRPGDGFRYRVGRILDMAEGLGRRLARGRALLEKGDLDRLRSRGTSTGGQPGSPAGHSARSIVYLPAVAWAYRFQRPQQLARALADHGVPVLYVDGFARWRVMPETRTSSPHPGLTVLHLRVPGRPDPYTTPMERCSAERVAATIVTGLRARPQAVVAQLPFWGPVAVEVMNRLDVPLLYDRIDLHTAFPGVPAAVGEAELELIRSADAVSASSHDLVELSLAANRRAVLLPNAVCIEDFPPAAAPPPAPPVRAGCVGAVDERFDAGAVRRAAEGLPDWEFELAGRVESGRVAEVADLRNVRFLGELPYPQVPRFLATLHVGFIPFRDLALTRAQDAVKRYEMMAVGLPVVGRRQRDAERWPDPLQYAYGDAGEVVGLLQRAVSDDRDDLRARRRRLVGEETWRRRAQALLQHIADTAADRMPG